MNLALLYLGAYLLGSVPFAVLIGRAKGVDILSVGSGNPGMTNVMRALGTGWGVACFVLDVAKGLIPTLLAQRISPGPVGSFDAQLLWFTVGVAAIIGHCCSVFLRFKGGKGISTALGTIIGTSPPVAACCFGLFAVLLALTRYMALSATIAVVSVLAFTFVVPGQSPQLLFVYVPLVAFVIFRHRKNFRRMKEGTEPKFSFRMKLAAPASSEPQAAPGTSATSRE